LGFSRQQKIAQLVAGALDEVCSSQLSRVRVNASRRWRSNVTLFRNRRWETFVNPHVRCRVHQPGVDGRVGLTLLFRPFAEDRVADLPRQVDGVFGVSGGTKIRTIRDKDRVTDVVPVESGEIGFKLFVGDGGKTYWANGVERTISIQPVGKQGGKVKGHRATSFLVKLEANPLQAVCLLEYIRARKGEILGLQEVFLVCPLRRREMAAFKVLLVDDDAILLYTLAKVLEHNDFAVTTAATVSEALKHISSEHYDVLLSDLHMPGAGDGLTVVSAMRHANPKAVTMLLSAFPEMGAAAHAIMLQADEILVKPMDVQALVDAIKNRLATGPSRLRVVESVATILERSAHSTIQDWFARVELEESLIAVPLSRELRCFHLTSVFRDLVERLRTFKPLGSKEPMSVDAAEHGLTRRKQGYSAAMMVEESRVLQVCIFNTLQENLASIDFSVLLIGVMTIADEVDSQLSQAMKSYIAESLADALPA
jgi:CheY-like chemotaxis protein